MKKRLLAPVLFNALLVGAAAAAAKVNFQRPSGETFDFSALNSMIGQITQVLVAAIIILVLVLVQGIFFFIRDLRQNRGE
jgi:low affinity Fe/Cu permease